MEFISHVSAVMDCFKMLSTYSSCFSPDLAQSIFGAGDQTSDPAQRGNDSADFLRCCDM
jgi:hypothetical protein